VEQQLQNRYSSPEGGVDGPPTGGVHLFQGEYCPPTGWLDKPLEGRGKGKRDRERFRRGNCSNDQCDFPYDLFFALLFLLTNSLFFVIGNFLIIVIINAKHTDIVTGIC